MATKKKKQTKIFTYIIINLIMLIMIYPLLWMLSSSFKPDAIIFQEMGLWPTQFTLDNYIKGWKGFSGNNFSSFYKNTFFIVGMAIIGNLISCSMAAYAFARMNFSFHRVLFAIMLTTMMLPFHVLLIPRYMIYLRLDWINSYLPLIAPKFLATDGFFIFLMVQFIRGIPRELDQSATVDGCSPIQIFYSILLPLLKPALITTTIFTFIWTWNDFFSQLIYISGPPKFTIALGLRAFLDTQGVSNWGAMFAMSIVSLVPILTFFIAFQRLIIEGVSTSGIKG